MRPILRVLQFVLLALALFYAGDYVSARFRIPGGRQTLGTVEVRTMWAIKQKDGRIDYELGDTQAQPCLRSIFPHLGYTPCWYLRSHANQVIKVGCRGIRAVFYIRDAKATPQSVGNPKRWILPARS